MSKSYRIAENAPPKARLPQSPKQRETPHIKTASYKKVGRKR